MAKTTKTKGEKILDEWVESHKPYIVVPTNKANSKIDENAYLNEAGTNHSDYWSKKSC